MINRKIDMPGVASAAQVAAEENAEIRALNDNWETMEMHPGGFKIVMGMKDGAMYSYGIQDDYEQIVELCAEYRKMEADNPKAYSGIGVVKWKLPAVVKFELEARGWPVDEMVSENALSELDRVIELEFPELKTTNLSLIPLK